jgi:DNA-binding PadR family transcriptional regulator
MTQQRKLLLMGLLRQTDMHGYLLNAHLDCTIPISLKKPTAYNLLDIMEKDGWIKHRTEHKGEMERKVYSVSKKGEVMFFKLLRQQLESFTPGEYPGMVSLSFIDAIPVKEAAQLLRKRKSLLEKHCSLFNQKTEDNKDPNNHHSNIDLVFNYIKQVLNLEMKFLNQMIKSMED